MVRRLRITFTEATVFREEYERNIVNGGAFVPTREEFEGRDLVEIELELGFCGESVVLEAEVVHAVSAEQASSAAACGVAVQFLEPAPVLRDRLERFLDKGGGDGGSGRGSVEPDHSSPFGGDDISGLDLEETPQEGLDAVGGDAALFDPSEVDLSAESAGDAPTLVSMERRKAPRVRTRVQARVDAKNISLEGRTRDLSEAGALVSADASDLPTGTDLKLELAHPVSGERIEVEGKVSRRVATEGTVAALGIEFAPEANGDEVATFVDEVHQAEEGRRSGGIHGVVEELGMETLVRMLGTHAKQGTLTLAFGAEEGTIAFDAGKLCCAQLGDLRGVKALSRFLSWERGCFEFHARLDAADEKAEGMALDDAVAQAVRQREDAIRADYGGMLDPAGRFAIDQDALGGEGSLTETQEAVLDLVAVGFSVRRILDVIPRPDAEVIESIKGLIDAKVLRAA